MKKLNNCVYDLSYQLVLVTNGRREVIDAAVAATIEEALRERCVTRQAEVIGFSHAPDHVEIRFSAPPVVDVAEMVNAMKTSSSRRARRDHAAARASEGSFWAPSYLAISLGSEVDATVLQDYLGEIPRA